MNDNVNHPGHYTRGFEQRPIECIDVTRHLPFSLGNAVKYVWRAGLKGDNSKAIEDLEKAEWYVTDCRYHSEALRNYDDSTATAILDLLQTMQRSDVDSGRILAIESLVGCNFEAAQNYIRRLKERVSNV
jgi:hypothetical protein